ncbi:GNAT family N-acetyltransferase [Leifsonia sp. Le1]|uniref:GNAT family N-acetyltransferase n=1 Tax=Leifsonia sp. Le1 TaxID=3404918 RepID=UPI003EBD4CBE
MHVLDNPAWHALTGAHRSFAVGTEDAKRYRPDMSPFAAVADPDGPLDALTELVGLSGGGDSALGVFGASTGPDGWETLGAYDCWQLVYEHETMPQVRQLGDDARLVALGDDDVPDALDLVDRTRPGPFLPRTIEFGGYRGIRVGDRLAAMAGQRMRPDGWCEVSAVCADPEFRGRGFAATVMVEVMRGIVARGERPFLHVEATNERALGVYEALGFTRRRRANILVCQPL